MSKMIPVDEYERIIREYKFSKNLDNISKGTFNAQYTDWERVYKQGSDSKYGTIMVSHEGKLYRDPTMGEFYGQGPWD